MNRLPTVRAGNFELPTGKIEVGDASWTKWLDSPGAKSFRFEGECGTFTARKETPKTGQPYWSAVRKIEGRLHKSYLGKTEMVTLEKLEEIAVKLTEPRPQKIRKPPTQQATELGNSVTSPQSEAVQQLQTQVAELSRQLRQLQEELPSLIRSQVAEAIAPTGEHPLEESGEVERLREENRQLLRQLADCQREKEELAREAQLWVERQGNSQTLVDHLKTEVEKFHQQVADQQVKIEELKHELAEVRSQQPIQPPAENLPDLKALGTEVLASLKLGRQAPGYQAAKKAIAQLIKRVNETTS